MCTPLALIGAVGSIASAGMSYMQQSNLMQQQENANANWVAYQRQKSQEEWVRQDAARNRAEAARAQSTADLTAEEQSKAQGTEAERLTKDFTSPDMLDADPTLIGDKLLSGQKGGSGEIQQKIAERITNASKDARARIAALATLQSFGPSQFGLQNRANDIFAKSGQEITMQGNVRQGSLAAYGAEKQVEPQRFQATPSPWGGLAGALAGIAGRGMGGASV
jgi:hypothetical protein